jgi:cell division protein FtsW
MAASRNITKGGGDHKNVDRFFLGIICALLFVGALAFISAALGVLARNETAFWGITFNQLVLGLIGGVVLMLVTARIPYTFWRNYAFYIFGATLLLMPLVFIPGIGFEHGGARRWADIGPITFQPAELLKIGFIMYFSAWLAWAKKRLHNIKYGILPFIVITGITAGLLLLQPDTKSLLLLIATGGILLFVAGVPIRYLIGTAFLGILLFAALVFTTPYLKARVQTFINPSHDPRGASYQLQQALIALGSGGITGRGFGQSVQKFSYLPEPHGDSIFAVVGEEFGFVGSVFVLLLYMAFALRGMRIAGRAPDMFSRLLSLGIVTIITLQSFLNIASITGVFPLTGVPLVFMSQGGTSLLISLAAIGIVLNISRFQRDQPKES